MAEKINPQTTLSTLSQQMQEAALSATGRISQSRILVYFENGQFRVSPQIHQVDSRKIIASFPVEKVREGLSSKEWNKLWIAVIKLCRTEENEQPKNLIDT